MDGFAITSHSTPQLHGIQQDYIHTEALSSQGLLVVVADGMGGRELGDLAAQLSATTIAQTIKNLLLPEVPIESLMQVAFTEANHKIAQEVALHKKRLGAAVTVALFYNKMLYVAWLGDVRCYIQSSDGIHHVNTDHKIQGTHNLYRSLNGRDWEKEVPIISISIDDCSHTLVCTDGFYNQLEEATLFDTVADSDFVSNGYDDCSYVSIVLTDI